MASTHRIINRKKLIPLSYTEVVYYGNMRVVNLDEERWPGPHCLHLDREHLECHPGVTYLVCTVLFVAKG